MTEPLVIFTSQATSWITREDGDISRDDILYCGTDYAKARMAFDGYLFVFSENQRAYISYWRDGKVFKNDILRERPYQEQA